MLDTSFQMLGPQFFQHRSPTSAARSANSRHRATWLALAGPLSIEQRKQVEAGDLTLLARTQTNLISQSLTLFVSVQTSLNDQGQHFVKTKPQLWKNYNYLSFFPWFRSHTMSFVTDPSFSLCRVSSIPMWAWKRDARAFITLELPGNWGSREPKSAPSNEKVTPLVNF